MCSIYIAIHSHVLLESLSLSLFFFFSRYGLTHLEEINLQAQNYIPACIPLRSGMFLLFFVSDTSETHAGECSNRNDVRSGYWYVTFSANFW